MDRALIARIELRTRCITDMELFALAKTLGVKLDAFRAEQAPIPAVFRRRLREWGRMTL